MINNQIKYVVFDGIDGAGKSSQVHRLCENLRKLNYSPIQLSEPTYGKYGREIRRRISTGDKPTLEEQNKLFTADRKEHIKYKINPLLSLIEKQHSSNGFMIVQDRSYYSAPAYQATGKEEMIKLLEEQQAFAPQPDLVILVDISVELAIERIKSRQGQMCMFEEYEFLREVRKNFQFIAQYKGRDTVAVVDGSESIDAISTKILSLLNLSTFEP